MSNELPQRTRVYEAWWSSLAWDLFTPRAGDIIVATPGKTGTTWVQTILLYLIFPGGDPPMLREVSSWLDALSEEDIRALDQQTHRRFVKTHTPLDGLPYYPEVTYLVVGRDGRDAFMSALNHYNTNAGENISLKDYWQIWIAHDTHKEPQAPLVSDKKGRLKYFLHYFKTFWQYRRLDNIHFIHFNDLLEDLPGEILRIASMVSMDISADKVARVAEAVKFSSVKKKSEQLYGPDKKGRVRSIVNKGTNRRWEEALTEDDVNAYHAIVNEVLTPECAQWLAFGRRASGFHAVK